MARQPAADLFPTEDPWPSNELIGRAEDVEELSLALANRTHRRLAAPRRTGKTTVCEAALAALRERDFYTVSVDLWEVADQSEFAEALVARTIANRPALRRARHRIAELGKGTASTIRITTRLVDELGSEVEVAWKPSLADRDPRRYLRYALELPQRVAQADGKRAVVFFDEFQNILELEERGRGKDGQALQKLCRTVFQRSKLVSVLFAGSYEHLMREIFAPEMPLGHFGGFHDLHEITAAEWRAGIRLRLRRDRSRISDDALDLLLERSELHPRATVLIAQQAYQAAVTAETHELDSALVRIGIEEAQRQERSKHEQVVDRIRDLGGAQTKRRALKVAKAIARGEPPYRKGAHSQTVSRAIDELRDAGLIESLGRGRGWRLVDPLLRHYLASLDPR
ncbi:MAG TPA: AAA family ATPase [Solirubrobacterales bacterium]|nr:AAA family ATPase [Solirubrobacterales bacterium]